MRSPPRSSTREPGYWLAKTLLIPWLGSSFRWHIEGNEHLPGEGPAIVAANHISFFDPLALAYTIHKSGRRPRFLAKGSLFKVPFVGWVLRTARQISVERGTESARSSLSEAESALRAGELVVIFPEGTTTIADDLAPAEPKTGTARVALATGLPVIPCATWGGQWVWSYHSGFRPGFGKEIWVRVGAPMTFEEYEGRKDDPEAWRSVSKLVMEEIAVLLAGLKAAKPWQPAPLPERTRRKLKEKGRI